MKRTYKKRGGIGRLSGQTKNYIVPTIVKTPTNNKLSPGRFTKLRKVFEGEKKNMYGESSIDSNPGEKTYTIPNNQTGYVFFPNFATGANPYRPPSLSPTHNNLTDKELFIKQNKSLLMNDAIHQINKMNDQEFNTYKDNFLSRLMYIKNTLALNDEDLLKFLMNLSKQELKEYEKTLKFRRKQAQNEKLYLPSNNSDETVKVDFILTLIEMYNHNKTEKVTGLGITNKNKFKVRIYNILEKKSKITYTSIHIDQLILDKVFAKLKKNKLDNTIAELKPSNNNESSTRVP